MKGVKSFFDRIVFPFPLPNIDPNILSGLSVLVSMLFVLFLVVSPLISMLFLIAVLVLDLLDGAVARRYGKISKEGELADLASDRLSEGIIFSVFFLPWFYLFVLNCLLSLFSVARGRRIIIPLRHIFVIFYVMWLL